MTTIAGVSLEGTEDENHYTRLHAVTRVVDEVGAEATGWLVGKLAELERWNWNSIPGGVDRRVYTLALLDLLDPAQAVPHAAALHAALAGEGSIARRRLEEILGERPLTTSAPEGGLCYALDRFGEALLEAVDEALRAEEANLPAPVERLEFVSLEGYILHDHLVVEGGGEFLEVEFVLPDTALPLHYDMPEDEEEAFEEFRAANGLAEEEEFFEWGDTLELPWSAVTLEYLRIGPALLERLRARGVQLAPDLKVETCNDPLFDAQQRLLASVRAELALLPSDLRWAIAALLYEDDHRRRELLED